MKYFNKKSVALIFIILIIFLFLLAPKPTFAAGPAFETNPLVWISNQIGAVASKLGASAAVATKIQQALEWAFKLATEILKRQLLNSVVNKTVEWIQGGGNPQFITDWPGFFRDAVNQAGGKFLQQLGLSRLCSPFKLTLKAAFYPIPTFGERTSCTMSQVGANLNAFLKDFKSGGWIAWNQMVLNPQNNVYGAYVMTWDQQEIEKAAAVKAAESEAQAGKGYLGVKKCLETDPAKFNSCMDSCIEGEGGSQATCAAPCKKSSCTKWETVTPGAAVGDAVAKAVGSNIDFIVNSEDLKAYTTAIANALLNRMFKEGLLHMNTTSSSFGATEGPPPLLPPSSVQIQAQCAQFLSAEAHTQAYKECLTAMQSGVTDVREFEKNYMISLIDQTLDNQNQILETKQADIFSLNESSNILKQLGDNCQSSLLSFFRPSEWEKALSRVEGVIPTVTNQITQTQSDIIALQTKKQEIEAITDLSQIPPLWTEFDKDFKPLILQSMDVSAAIQDTSTRQEDLTTWYKSLISCCPSCKK